MKTSRRTKGEGSIIQLTNGKWRARIECEPVDGKRKWLSKTCDTKTEAIKALQELIKRRDTQTQAKPFKGNFPAICDEYLESCRLRGLRDTSITRYINALSYWVEAFKFKKIKNINFVDIERGIAEQRKQEKQDTTLVTDLTILSQVFNFAKKCKYTNYNPVTEAGNKPKCGTCKQSDEPLYETTLEHEDIIRYFKEKYDTFKYTGKYSLKSIFYVLYMTTYCTGLRLGEITGLQWSDIDLNTGLIIVHQQFVNGKYVPLKTENSKRYLYLSPDILELLKSYKEVCKLHNVESVYLWKSSRANKPFVPSYVSSTFKSIILELCANKHLTFHSIRHTFATLLMNAKIPIKGISELLGHSGIEITTKIYTHVDDTTAIEAAHVVGNAAFASHNQVTIESQKGYLKGVLKGNEITAQNTENRINTAIS